jgi:hypothetical protein
VIKVYALLVGRPWREPKYSYLIAFYEELRAGTIGRDRGKKAARGAPVDIIASPRCTDITCRRRCEATPGAVREFGVGTQESDARPRPVRQQAF